MNRAPLLLVGLLALFTQSTRAADWPQLLGPARNGSSPETGLLQTWPKEGPAVLWQKEAGEGFSGPVVAGDRLILFHRVKDEDVVECLDPATGNPRWRFAYATEYHDPLGMGNGPRATPTIAGDRVYTLGAQGSLHCLELATGKQVWERSLDADYTLRQSYFGVGTSPLVEGDLVLVNVGGRKGGIVAFNKETGKEVWKATDHAASYSSPVAATLDGARRVIFFTREGLVVLDPTSGRVQATLHWRSRMDASVNAATPLVLDGDIFLSACYGTGAGLFRVKKDQVDTIWSSDEVLSNHYVTSVARGEFLYGFDGRHDRGVTQLRCIEWKTGKVRWTHENLRGGPIILADGNLIILDEEGELLLVEATPEAYREKARAAVLGRPCRAPTALAEGRLFGRDDHRLMAWKVK